MCCRVRPPTLSIHQSLLDDGTFERTKLTDILLGFFSGSDMAYTRFLMSQLLVAVSLKNLKQCDFK